MRYAWLALALAACSEWGLAEGPEPPVTLSAPPAAEPVWQTDHWQFPLQPEVDILFVVDNSCSMDDNQAQLANNFHALFDTLPQGVAYRVAVTTTDTYMNGEEGRLVEAFDRTYIYPGMPDAQAVFSAMVSVGTYGSPSETGAAAAYMAIEHRWHKGYEANADWHRPSADLHIIFVSDENDVSLAPTPAEFLEWLAARPLTTAHAIVWRPEEACPEASVPGSYYVEYAEATGGVARSICGDWSETLEDIGLQVAGVDYEMALTHNPVRGTITAEVEGVTYEACAEGCPVAYIPGRNTLVPWQVDVPEGAMASATYQVAGAY